MSKLRVLIEIYKAKLDSDLKKPTKPKEKPLRKQLPQASPLKTLSSSEWPHRVRRTKIPPLQFKASPTKSSELRFNHLLKKSKSFVEINQLRYKSTQLPEIVPSFDVMPALKFKRLDPSAEYGLERLFPASRHRSSNSVTLHSKNPDIKEIKDLIRKSFIDKQRLICVVYRSLQIFKHAFISCDIPLEHFDDTEVRESFKRFHESIYDQFYLNRAKPIYLFDTDGKSLSSLAEMLPKCYVVLLSTQPTFEDLSESQLAKTGHLRNLIIAAHWDSGILVEQFVEKMSRKRQLRHAFLKKYSCCDAQAVKDSRDPKIQMIRKIYSRLDEGKDQKEELVIEDTVNRGIFFRSTERKKDFTLEEVKLIKNFSLGLHSKHLPRWTLALGTNKNNHYPLSHRDLLMHNKSISHDVVIDTKFNRKELFQLKSIYDSLVSLSLKDSPSKYSVLRLGLDIDTFVEGIRMFGFSTSVTLLKDYLKESKYLDWKEYLKVMEILIHKEGDEALNEYLSSIKGRSDNEGEGQEETLDYSQVLRMVKYGLERLLIYKDSFYDGYEHVIAKNIFEGLGVSLDSRVNVVDLRRLADDTDFRHIFLS